MDGTWSIAQTLRHARHDHLNELQLISLNLSLGRYDRVKELIDGAAREAEVWRKLTALNMPKTEEWLLLAKWRFPELHIVVKCETSKAPHRLDGAFSEIAESVMTKIRAGLDGETACACTISLAGGDGFALVFEVDGMEQTLAMPEKEGISLTVEEKGSLQTITASARMEG